MRTWTSIFSCPGLIQPRRWRWGARRGVAPELADTARVSPAPEVSVRRAEAMRALFPKLASWIDRQGHAAAMGEIHYYLSQATDLVDLEQRIRQVERRRVHCVLGAVAGAFAGLFVREPSVSRPW